MAGNCSPTNIDKDCLLVLSMMFERFPNLAVK